MAAGSNRQPPYHSTRLPPNKHVNRRKRDRIAWTAILASQRLRARAGPGDGTTPQRASRAASRARCLPGESSAPRQWPLVARLARPAEGGRRGARSTQQSESRDRTLLDDAARRPRQWTGTTAQGRVLQQQTSGRGIAMRCGAQCCVRLWSPAANCATAMLKPAGRQIDCTEFRSAGSGGWAQERGTKRQARETYCSVCRRSGRVSIVVVIIIVYSTAARTRGQASRRLQHCANQRRGAGIEPWARTGLG